MTPVERAARALYIYYYTATTTSWENASEASKGFCMKLAELALTAVNFDELLAAARKVQDGYNYMNTENWNALKDVVAKIDAEAKDVG